MRVLVVTPPEPVVTLETAKQHLRVLHGREDALITAYVAAATAHIDGPAGWLGRAIGQQVLEARGAPFARDSIRLPYPPIVAIESIEYEDATGVWQAVDADEYELRGDVVGSAWGASWPQTRTYRGSAETVRIRYTAGYESVPEPIRVAVLLMTGDMYANRQTAVIGTISAEIKMSTTVENLLAPYRDYR